jgi:hypothetical protein
VKDRRRTRAVGLDQVRQQSQRNQIVDTTVHKCRRHHSSGIPQHDRPTSHQISWPWPGGAPHNQRARKHPAAGITTSLACDHNRAPTHPVAGAITGIAAHHDNTAAHTCDLAWQGAAEPVACGAGNFQITAVHAGSRPRARIAVDDQPSAPHSATGFYPDIAVYLDFAIGHFVSDEVQAVASAFNANVLRVPHAHTKNLTDRDALAGRAQLQSRDFGCRFSRQQMRHERRQIEALIGALPEREHQRFHGSSSFKWK